jgi:hypothetical protein
VRPLPGGDQYLGLVFAGAATAGEAEKAVMTASQRLHAVIEGDEHRPRSGRLLCPVPPGSPVSVTSGIPVLALDRTDQLADTNG